MASVLAQIVSAEPERPSLLRPDLNPLLEGIVMKAMAKKAVDRDGSMKQPASAQPTKRIAPPLSAHAAAPTPRHRWATLLAYTVVPAAVVLLSFGALHLAGALLPASQDPVADKEKTGEKDNAGAARLLSSKAVLKYTFKNPSGNLTALRPVAFSPDWQLAVVSSEGKTAELWDLQAGKIRHVLKDNPGEVTAAAFDPKGQRVALGSFKQINVFDVATGQRLATVDDGFPPLNVYWLSFCRQGQLLHGVVMNDVNGGKQLVLADPATGQVLQKVEDWPWSWDTARDGDTLVVTHKFGDADLWHLNAKTAKLKTGKGLPRRCDRALVRGNVVVAWSGAEIYLYEVPSATEKVGHTLHTQDITSADVSPDGKHIASMDKAREVILWDVQNKKKVRRWTVNGLAGESPEVKFSADGTMLAVSSAQDKTIQLWAVPTASCWRALASLPRASPPSGSRRTASTWPPRTPAAM
jgi:dipeptidyl aminopeptidase/acylaminoacyl peptidase